jgi:hypothetical protein
LPIPDLARGAYVLEVVAGGGRVTRAFTLTR